jgi:polysaccharide pyruvyl transferase WcaK-like protein
VAQLLTQLRPGTDVVFHYGNSSNGTRRLNDQLEVQVRNCRLSLKSAAADHILFIMCLALLHRMGVRAPAQRNRWLRSLLDAEFVGDITGGDSFSDIYGFRRFLSGSLPLLSVALLGKPYVMLPQTYGPFRSRLARALAAFLLRNAATILTRDQNSEATVLALAGRLPRFCPDVAFTLKPVEPKQIRMEPTGLRLGCGDSVVGLNVSGLLYMGGYTQRNMFGLRWDYRKLIDALVDAVLGSTTASVLLVPHVFGTEVEEEACAALMRSAGARFPGRVFSLTAPLSEGEIKWIIGRTDFFVGSRMHACIAALSQSVPAVGLAYSDKFLGVFQSVGVGDAVVDLRTADPEAVVERTLSMMREQAEIRRRLSARIPLIQQEIASALSTVLACQAEGEQRQDSNCVPG